MTSRTSLDYPDRDSNHSRGVFRALEKTHREAVQGVSARTLKRRHEARLEAEEAACMHMSLGGHNVEVPIKLLPQ